MLKPSDDQSRFRTRSYCFTFLVIHRRIRQDPTHGQQFLGIDALTGGYFNGFSFPKTVNFRLHGHFHLSLIFRTQPFEADLRIFLGFWLSTHSAMPFRFWQWTSLGATAIWISKISSAAQQKNAREAGTSDCLPEPLLLIQSKQPRLKVPTQQSTSSVIRCKLQPTFEGFIIHAYWLITRFSTENSQVK